MSYCVAYFMQFRPSSGGSGYGAPDSRFDRGAASGGRGKTSSRDGGEWTSRGSGDRNGIPALRPMVHSASQIAAQGGIAPGLSSVPSSKGLSSSSMEGMTEEQRALEEARLERELLERRKLAEQQAKKEAEEAKRREAEMARLQEERSRERVEKERHVASAYDAQQQRGGSGSSRFPVDDGDRWARAAPPPLPAPQQR